MFGGTVVRLPYHSTIIPRSIPCVCGVRVSPLVSAAACVVRVSRVSCGGALPDTAVVAPHSRPREFAASLAAAAWTKLAPNFASIDHFPPIFLLFSSCTIKVDPGGQIFLPSKETYHHLSNIHQFLGRLFSPFGFELV